MQPAHPFPHPLQNPFQASSTPQRSGLTLDFEDQDHLDGFRSPLAPILRRCQYDLWRCNAGALTARVG